MSSQSLILKQKLGNFKTIPIPNVYYTAQKYKLLYFSSNFGQKYAKCAQ